VGKGYYCEKAERHIAKLCLEIGERCVGSSGNRKATTYAAAVMRDLGFYVETPGFGCFDWQDRGSALVVGGESFRVLSNPYTLGGEIKAPLSPAASVEELEQVAAKGRIAFLHGQIAAEQLMPKNFTFYNPAEHRRINKLLESRGFKAVIAATSYNPEAAGGIYPFPLIEDGDFNLPGVYMTESEGERFLGLYQEEKVFLKIDTERKPSAGCNVIGRRGEKPSQRIVVMAHIDSKKGTTGAIDNATGTAVLLVLAEMLAGYNGRMVVELAAVNGEDYYSNPGEMLYLEENRGRFDEIILGINIDGAGYCGGSAAYSCYECPEEIKTAARKVFDKNGLVEGEPWYQGDHGLFLYNNRPALAITSTALEDLLNIAHTPDDKPEIIDYDQIVEVAGTVYELLINISERC